MDNGGGNDQLTPADLRREMSMGLSGPAPQDLQNY
eukprot:CAMPEP_0174333844 /NCGR_PEP_ID=MMETSP0810-20121108/19463_1 /TAXON_ID=73025 ORGANISM="Eutreptiella gymnastica-like, Strain CCMP1594" /NCGR_SAMPLE_ID=MMETSP0810 /ASSEMBLY_ACC=CAM_ASM_000659 /LENGTH=34 /DNA_ID= /DNA_START= /DNA_END= /DNA_ORIENTATION=